MIIVWRAVTLVVCLLHLHLAAAASPPPTQPTWTLNVSSSGMAYASYARPSSSPFPFAGVSTIGGAAEAKDLIPFVAIDSMTVAPDGSVLWQYVAQEGVLNVQTIGARQADSDPPITVDLVSIQTWKDGCVIWGLSTDGGAADRHAQAQPLWVYKAPSCVAAWNNQQTFALAKDGSTALFVLTMNMTATAAAAAAADPSHTSEAVDNDYVTHLLVLNAQSGEVRFKHELTRSNTVPISSASISAHGEVVAAVCFVSSHSNGAFVFDGVSGAMRMPMQSVGTNNSIVLSDSGDRLVLFALDASSAAWLSVWEDSSGSYVPWQTLTNFVSGNAVTQAVFITPHSGGEMLALAWRSEDAGTICVDLHAIESKTLAWTWALEDWAVFSIAAWGDYIAVGSSAVVLLSVTGEGDQPCGPQPAQFDINSSTLKHTQHTHHTLASRAAAASAPTTLATPVLCYWTLGSLFSIDLFVAPLNNSSSCTHSTLHTQHSDGTDIVYIVAAGNGAAAAIAYGFMFNI